MRNCWTFAVPRLESRDGWLLVRFTKRSSAKPSRLFGWLGVALVAIGIAAINWGAMLRTGALAPRLPRAPDLRPLRQL